MLWSSPRCDICFWSAQSDSPLPATSHKESENIDQLLEDKTFGF